ncbi:MAG TPA: hypothetical protein VKA77_00720 [Mycobacterium sp.]|nr:hypothetical protein [Mycobacterium sp.]
MFVFDMSIHCQYNFAHTLECMKNYVAVSFISTAIAAFTVALAAVASAAPSGPSSVDQTVQTLEASGYNVIVNRTGATPLSECTVSSVRPGQTHATNDSRGGGSINTTVTSQTVYVDVDC